MSKKGLFVVKSPSGKIMKAEDMDRNNNTFDNKMTAKTARNLLNTGADVTPEMSAVGIGFTVSKGPGHWKNL
jgi:hypothetical protein